MESLEKPIDIELSSSRIKLFKKYFNRYWLNELYSSTIKNFYIFNRNIVLKDINNFRKYYNYFSFSYEIDQIKEIFIDNDLSLVLLHRYIESSDYLYLRGLNKKILQSGITVKKYKYNNILIDLKAESILKSIIYDYSISELFNFRLIDQTLSLEISNIQSIKDYNKSSNLNKDYYNGYCGNFETYCSIKELLKLYLNGIVIYYYKGNYYTFKELKNNKDKLSVDQYLKVEGIQYECKTIIDPLNLDSKIWIKDSLANLKIELVVKNKNLLYKKIIFKNLSDFL